MEPLKYRLGTLVRETVILPEDDRDISPSRPPPNAKQTRKGSTIPAREEEKILSKTSKRRMTLAQNTQHMSTALKFSKPRNYKSNDGTQVSAVTSGNNDHETTACLAQLTLNKPNNTGHEASAGLQHFEDNIDQLVDIGSSLSNEVDPKNVSLEEKLADDHELEMIGIMNLSSMNLTDEDLPVIIQRAFWEQRKKCIGLILRDNAITSRGVKMLVDELLATRTYLKYLSLSNNINVGDEGIEHLVRLLQKNRSITFLAIPNTGITDRSVRLLADLLCGIDADMPCPPLEKLHISFNKAITDQSLEAFLQILEQNQTLKLLSLQHCSLSDKARRQLRQVGAKKKKKKFILSE